MQKIVCRLDEVPLDTGIHSYLNHKYHLSERYGKMPYQLRFDRIIRFRMPGFEPAQAVASVHAASEQYGWWGFMTHFKDSSYGRDTYYGGFSITHNPDLYYMVPESASTLGEPKVNLHDFFDTALGRRVWIELEERKLTAAFTTACFKGGLPEAYNMLLHHGIITGPEDFDWDKSYVAEKRQNRNGYFDSYGFRYLTSAAKHGYHGDFLQHRFKRSLIRSRMAYIDGTQYSPTAGDYMWHCDEPIILNLRINIPLQTSDNYAFEIKDSYLGKFEVGYGYCWNTEILHRVFAAAYDPTPRIHMVIGSSPWFDYDDAQKAYVSNEYFGEMHPFDMLAAGHIIDNVEICQ